MTKLKIEFVSIKAGMFTMGRIGVLQENYPVIPAEITKAFKIAKYPITQSQWVAVMNTRPWLEFEISNKPKYPAVGISYVAAQAFSEQASKLLKKRILLPTEVQWEYCCRAGTQTEFYWENEDDFSEYAWSRECQGERSVREVGLLKPNAWGLYDMAGNVAEWVRDRCDTDGPMLSKKHYPKTIKDFVSLKGEYAICRGGSFNHSYSSMSSASKDFMPLECAQAMGFRVVEE